MAHQASRPTVAAVVAAYNEEARLGSVLDTLATYPGFDEVIVVDDGSTDRTAEVARRHGVTCIQLPTNAGKGAAMEAGVRHASTDVLFFADADIRHLDHATITTMLGPVVAGDVDMFVAMRRRSLYLVRSVLRFLPLLGGERAVTAKLWHAVPPHHRRRFKVEAALNFYAVHHGNGLRYRVFPISQTRKEAKFGVVRGVLRRTRMAVDVGVAILDVQLSAAPADARARRRAAVLAMGATATLARTVRAVPTAPPRRAGALAVATISGAVVVTQLVRLAQSSARADA